MDGPVVVKHHGGARLFKILHHPTLPRFAQTAVEIQLRQARGACGQDIHPGTEGKTLDAVVGRCLLLNEHRQLAVGRVFPGSQPYMKAVRARKRLGAARRLGDASHALPLHAEDEPSHGESSSQDDRRAPRRPPPAPPRVEGEPPPPRPQIRAKNEKRRHELREMGRIRSEEQKLRIHAERHAEEQALHDAALGAACAEDARAGGAAHARHQRKDREDDEGRVRQRDEQRFAPRRKGLPEVGEPQGVPNRRGVFP